MPRNSWPLKTGQIPSGRNVYLSLSSVERTYASLAKVLERLIS